MGREPASDSGIEEIEEWTTSEEEDEEPQVGSSEGDTIIVLLRKTI